jgi:uncharacterized protein YjbI with pentapeptide repeats
MNASTDQCEYVHDPDEWEPAVSDATSRLPQERWECPHEAVDERTRCVFHLSSDDRKELDISDRTVVDGFLQALHSKTERTNEFVGASFPAVDLEAERIEAASTSPIDLRCATFNGDVKLNRATISNSIRFAGSRFRKRCELQGTSFARQADFYGCDFGGVVKSEQATFAGQALFARADFTYSAYFRDGAEFQSDATFTKVRFGSNASFRSAQFDGQAYFRETQFHGDGRFDGALFDGTVDFGDSEFIDAAEFTGTEFYATAYFGANGPHSDYGAASFEVEPLFEDIHAFGDVDFEWVVFEEGVTFDGAVLEADVEFTRTSIHDHLNFIRSESSGRFIYRPINSGSGPTVLHVTDSTITDGVLAQPLGGTAFFAFDGATVGSIEILDTVDGPYDLIHELSDLGRTRFVETRFRDFDFTSYRPTLESNWKIHKFETKAPVEPLDLDGTALELTYMRAKSGAKAIGDNRSAAGFFVNEMRGRKRRHQERFEEARSLDEKATAGIDYMANEVFDQSCRYSESPVRLLFASFVPVAGFALLYAIIGILTGTTAPYQSAPPLLNYLIFSGESFITLVHSPGATVSLWYVRILSLLEGYVGALLIALFLFSLTRAVHR